MSGNGTTADARASNVGLGSIRRSEDFIDTLCIDSDGNASTVPAESAPNLFTTAASPGGSFVTGSII